MSREWQPGSPIPDGKYAVTFTWNDVAITHLLAVLRDHYAAGYASMGGHVARAVNGRPLVVVDPEDREQVRQLLRGYYTRPYENVREGSVTNMQAALREFANPKPPKPDEPMGHMAVVEDVKGRRWVNWRNPKDQIEHHSPWISADDSDDFREYVHIDAVRVLSEGVTS